MKPIKMNFFEQIFYAVAKPKQYYKLSKVSGGRLTGFVFLLMLIVTIISTVFPIINVFVGSDGIFNQIDNELPYFEMKNGNLFVEERYENSDNDTYILVDTNVDSFNYEDIDKSYNQVVLISKTNYFQYSSGRTQELAFRDFKEFDFNKDIIQVFKPFIYIILVLVVIFIYLFVVGGYFFTSLLYSLVGLFVSSVNKIRLPFGMIFKVAVYSKVTIKLLYTLIGIFDQSMPSGVKNIIAIIVTCTYVVFGILSHKSDEAISENMGIPQNNYYDNNYNNNNYNGNNYNNNNGNYNNNNYGNNNYNNGNYGNNNYNNGNYDNNNYNNGNYNNGNNNADNTNANSTNTDTNNSPNNSNDNSNNSDLPS